MKLNVRNKLLMLSMVLSLSVFSACGNNDGNNANKSDKSDKDNQEVTDEVTDENKTESNTPSTEAQDIEPVKSAEDAGQAVMSGSRPVVVGHRGYSAIAPDNSMPSFQAASDFGADMIELDVQMTKDKYIVVYHDFNLKFITGEDGKVSDYTYEELRQFSIGDVYDEKTGKCLNCTYTGYTDEKLPTLNDVMRFARDNGIGVDIEIKSIGDVTEYTDEEISWFLQEVVNIVEENEMIDNTIFSSFNYLYLQEIEEMDPSYVTFFITNVMNMDAFVNKCITDGIAISYDCIEDDTVERLHEANKEVYIWTVDNLEMLQFVTAMGADGIITNNVGLSEYFR